MKGSLIILGFFALGTLMGYLGFIPPELIELSPTKYVLYGLMFCVGITMGADRTLVSQLKNLNWRITLLPLMTALGTLSGVLVLWVIMNKYSAADYLALGSGFAYYSLSSIFITEIRGVELGTIALLSNVIREIIALLFIPAVGKRLGPLAAITMGGATTFDTTLPIITQTVGKKYVVLSIFHGAVLDFSVPLLVTLFCGLAT